MIRTGIACAEDRHETVTQIFVNHAAMFLLNRVDTRSVRLNPRTERNSQKIHAREIGVDKQSVAFEFELVTVRAEISHAHAVARSCAGVAAPHCKVTARKRCYYSFRRTLHQGCRDERG